METELIEMGFDYCYDKVFYDRMHISEVERMRHHFHAEPGWLLRTARFLENHDEHRSAHLLHFQRHMAAAALVAFGPGMRFWHMGQWDGWRRKIPVQICRLPHEPPCGCILRGGERKNGKKWSEKTHALPIAPVCACVHTFYERLLKLNQEKLFRDGEWRVVHEHVGEPGLICWLWSHQHEHALVAVNFSDKESLFSLADQLHLLHLGNPEDVMSETTVDSHQVHSLTPWGVYVWKAKSIT
jgi:hypothetical protein